MKTPPQTHCNRHRKSVCVYMGKDKKGTYLNQRVHDSLQIHTVSHSISWQDYNTFRPLKQDITKHKDTSSQHFSRKVK